jgi:hypothetical protein
MTKEAFTVAYGGLPLEGEARDGELTWQTLICADRTPSGSLVVGVAEFPPGGHLKFHRHDPSEFYFCLGGSAVVHADDKTMELSARCGRLHPGRDDRAGTTARHSRRRWRLPRSRARRR